MMSLLVIFGIVIIISSGCCVFSAEHPSEIICIIVTVVFSIFFGMISSNISHNKEPQPLDVYRGNTTLQVTYQDSVAIDSVVVFKK